MGDYVKISVSALTKDQSQIQENMEEVKQAVLDLGEEMKMLGATWEGPAWQTFQNQVSADMEFMQQVCDNLGVYLQHIQYARTQYQTCENRMEQLVNQIRI